MQDVLASARAEHVFLEDDQGYLKENSTSETRQGLEFGNAFVLPNGDGSKNILETNQPSR